MSDSDPQNSRNHNPKFDVGDNIAKILTSIFEPLKGDRRIIGGTLSVGVLVLLISVIFLRENNLLSLGLGFGILIIIMPPIFLLILREQETRKTADSRAIKRREEMLEITIIAYSGSKTNVVSGAKVFVTGAPKGDSGKTNSLGEWPYRYPSYYVEQNQTINIRVTKEGIGIGEEFDYPLSARTKSLGVNLTPQNETSIDISQDRAGNGGVILNSQDRRSLAELLRKSGRANASSRPALLIAIDMPSDLDFAHMGVPAKDFAIQLVEEIERMGRFNSMILLCEELKPYLAKGIYEHELERIGQQIAMR